MTHFVLVQLQGAGQFDGSLRDECLNVEQFASLHEARIIIGAWRVACSQRRSHSSLGHLSPKEFLSQCETQQTVEEVVGSG